MAVAIAVVLHFGWIDRLPPGVCYDGATLACFAANVGEGRPVFAGLDRVEGVGEYRRLWAEAALPASAAVAGLARLLGIPPERMEEAELRFETGAALAGALLLALWVRSASGSRLLAAAALVLLSALPGHWLHARAGPHLFAVPIPFWTGALLLLWLGRRRGRWLWGLSGWAVVGLSGLFFYASLVALPFAAALLTWWGGEPGLTRRERLGRLAGGAAAAAFAYALPAGLLGFFLAGGDALAVPLATVRFYLGQRGGYSPPDVPALLLPFTRLADLGRQLYGGEPPRYLFQAEVDMWVVPGRVLIPWAIQLLLAWAVVRRWREGRRGPGGRYLAAGLLLPILFVAATTMGEVRYVAPAFAFLVAAAVFACRPPEGRGEPGVLGRVFLLALVLLGAGEGLVTGLAAHAGNRWGVKPMFMGLRPVVARLEAEVAGTDPARVRILAADYIHIRYHLALYSRMALCPHLGDFDRLLPEGTRDALARGEIEGRVTAAFVLQTLREKGLFGGEVRTLWLLGLGSDARLQAVGRWCGLVPALAAEHPFGRGEQWVAYRLEG